VDYSVKLGRKLGRAESLVMVTCVVIFIFAAAGALLALFASLQGGSLLGQGNSYWESLFTVLLFLNFGILTFLGILLLVFKSRAVSIALFVYIFLYQAVIGYIMSGLDRSLGLELIAGFILQFFIVFGIVGAFLYQWYWREIKYCGLNDKPALPHDSQLYAYQPLGASQQLKPHDHRWPFNALQQNSCSREGSHYPKESELASRHQPSLEQQEPLLEQQEQPDAR